jgi:hypothetical protein
MPIKDDHGMTALQQRAGVGDARDPTADDSDMPHDKILKDHI